MTFDLDHLGAGLPVAKSMPALGEALVGGTVVVQAPPGTGKTTLVPPAVANAVVGKVVVTQPRRVAARMAARRLAALAGVRVGEEVGYVVRGDQATSARTRVEFDTAGVLLRRLLADPELDGIGAVVLDEVHERALETDLAFAMLAELRELRPDLVLVVMSATLDASRWAQLLGGAPIVAVEADLHPLEVRWAPAAGSRTDARGVAPGFLDHLASQSAAVFAEGRGSVLTFAPGSRECERVAERLRARGVPAEALHGSLDPRAQDRVLRDGAPRVIVATSIAESALTVPGVRTVVDSGLAREPRYDAGRAMTGLVTVSEARSSALQRAGRAARLGPGVVVRCFPESDWSRLRPFTAPEILTGDLTQAALDLAVWGSPGGVGLALPDTPPAAALAQAITTLRGLGAIDAEGRATQIGRRLSRLPVDPRLGRALVECGPRWGVGSVSEVVALLAGDERVEEADLVAAWRRAGRTREADRLARLVAETARDSAAILLPEGEAEPHDGAACAAASATGRRLCHVDDDAVVGEVVATAFPDRVARRRGQEYLLASGTAVALPRGSRLGGEEWLAVAETSRVGDRALIRAAAPLTEETARRAAAGLLTDDTEAVWADGRITARRVSRLGAIELTSTPVRAEPDVARAAVVEALRVRGLWTVLRPTDGFETLRRRLALLHAVVGAPWPDVDEDALLARVEEWLGPELDALARGSSVGSLDLTSALRRLLPWPEAGRLDDLVPERLEVPTGSRIRLDYPADPADRVVLAVKLQECFGLVDTPRLVDGRVPVLMHLLSPAQRPLAVTDDLASFWANAYPAVRAENRGRYAKHPWPEDPLTAPPRRGTTRSGR